MPERLSAWFNREVRMPRWTILLDALYRLALFSGAVIVAVLWWQAATRDEEADRNLRVQACASYYAATYDAHAGAFLAAVARAASEETPDLTELRTEGEAAAEMALRRIGLAAYAADAPNDFACPPLPARLEVEGIDP